MGEIARTYPSRYQDGELIVIRDFSFLENVSRLLTTAIQRRNTYMLYQGFLPHKHSHHASVKGNLALRVECFFFLISNYTCRRYVLMQIFTDQ